jgi:hypothetical protein
MYRLCAIQYIVTFIHHRRQGDDARKGNVAYWKSARIPVYFPHVQEGDLPEALQLRDERTRGKDCKFTSAKRRVLTHIVIIGFAVL